jgi:excisionase family DNA binding protein
MSQSVAGADTAAWMTIEQAAVALGVSVRTVNRHINAGKLQSRLADGRREVLLDDTAATAPIFGASAATAAAAAAAAATHVASGEIVGGVDGQAAASSRDAHLVDYETVLALADNAADKAELAVSAYQALARSADERIRANRRLSCAAWSFVALFAVGAVVSVGWASHKLTRAAVETRHLEQQVTTVTAMADEAHDECDDLRRALAAARETAARNEGQLAAHLEPRPADAATTRPTLTERIASIFEE